MFRLHVLKVVGVGGGFFLLLLWKMTDFTHMEDLATVLWQIPFPMPQAQTSNSGLQDCGTNHQTTSTPHVFHIFSGLKFRQDTI